MYTATIFAAVAMAIARVRADALADAFADLGYAADTTSSVESVSYVTEYYSDCSTYAADYSPTATVTNLVVDYFCPECEQAATATAATDAATVTTYVTAYSAWCPESTALELRTYTVTESCSAPGLPHPSGYLPAGFAVVTETCHLCPAPFVATLTVPLQAPPAAATAPAPTSSGPLAPPAPVVTAPAVLPPAPVATPPVVGAPAPKVAPYAAPGAANSTALPCAECQPVLANGTAAGPPILYSAAGGAAAASGWLAAVVMGLSVLVVADVL